MRAAARLLLVEAEALPKVLRRAALEDFDLPTACPEWSVRDVLAHCGAALGGFVRGTAGSFSSEDNQREVDERAAWPIEQVLDELFGNYVATAGLIDELDGLADGLALGEWVHGGDVRDPLGEPDAYASVGVDLAVPLISARSADHECPAVDVAVDGGRIPFGVGSPVGALSTDLATFVRLVAGRAPDAARYRLVGDITVEQLLLFS
jgi:uncharacterized protein (TIGR03083 family)